MNARLAAVAVATTTLLGSLAGTASAHPVRNASHPAVFGAKNTGQTIAVKRGTTFKVSLEACRDCGAHWSFSHRPAAATLTVEHKTVKPEATPPAVGGDDHTIWTFKGTGKGKTTMRMVERSADSDNKVIKRFNLTVEVA